MFRSAATKIAHNSTIPALAGNQDLRPLQDLILAEKAVIISLQKLTADFSKASEALKTWGLGEGEDLGNILSASTTIITHFTSALSQYASHGHMMREQLKAIRTREENLDELRRRRRSVMSKADSADKKLQKMGPEHKNLAQQMDILNRFREEIRGLDVEIMQNEAALGDFKRAATRSWMGLKFGGLLECCEKGVIVGEYGKLVVSEIPEDQTQPGLPRNPYFGYAKVEELVAETHRYVNEVRLSTVPSADTQPRRAAAEQHLPQLPNTSDSPFVNQGNYSTSVYPPQPHPALDPYHEERRDVLPDSQGLGTGRFLDSPTEATPNPFSQNQQPNRPQYSGSLSSASAFQYQSDRQVDEFGNNIIPTGPIDTSSASGGRFATFPVRGRTGSMGGAGGAGYQPGPDAFPSLLSSPSQHSQSDSFSTSVVQALAASSHDNDQEPPLPPVGKPGRFSKDGPAPSYESSVDSENPWSGNTTAASRLGPNDHLTAATHSRQTSNLSDEEALLAYMSPPPTTNAPAVWGGGVGVDDKHVSRHVRFGTISEIDDAPLPPITPQDSLFSSSPEPTGMSSGSQGQREGNRGLSPDSKDARESQVVAFTTSSPEEKALDAAAAREIALELQSAASSSTAHAPNTDDQSPPGGNASQASREMTPSPLAPPTASYMSSDRRRSVSPRPPINVTTTSPPAPSPDISSPGPAPSYTEELLPQGQQYHNVSTGLGTATTPSPTQYKTPVHDEIQTQSRPSPEVSSPHAPVYAADSPPHPPGAQEPHRSPGPYQPYEQTFNPYEEPPQLQERGRDYLARSGYTGQQIPVPPPQINVPSEMNQHGSFSYYAQPGAEVRGGGATGGAYEPKTYSVTPQLEQPNAPYMRPGGNRSTSSLTSPTAGGGKISAAAFKRPSPRLGGGSPSPFAPPSPSPFSTGSTSPGGAGTRMSPTEGKRLPSPYDSSHSEPAPGYSSTPGQNIQPLNIKKRETQELDADQYDYINAYVNNGEDDQGPYYVDQAQRAANAQAGGGGWAGIGSGGGQEGVGRGGYGQGRFATNLDSEHLR